MSENIVKRSEFVSTRKRRYTKVICYHYFHGCAGETCTNLHRLLGVCVCVCFFWVLFPFCGGGGGGGGSGVYVCRCICVEVQNVFHRCAFVTHP